MVLGSIIFKNTVTFRINIIKFSIDKVEVGLVEDSVCETLALR